MQPIRLSLAALAASFVVVAAPAASTSPPAFTLVDLTDDYARFFDRTVGAAPDQRLLAFKAEFATLLPGFYEPSRLAGLASEDQYHQMITRSFEAFPERRAEIEQSAAIFASLLGPARDEFAQHFPDLAPMGNIYLVHSVGEMDGGVRTLGGKRSLIFGADMIATLYNRGDEKPFFQHEVFHVYHRQFLGPCEQLWCSLWTEGLAVQVAAQLNPGATDAQLGLALPRPIRPEVEANLTTAVCAVASRLDSTSREDYAPLFMGQASLDGLPPRFGYFIGYLAAREAARTRTLQELAHLTVAEARAVVDAGLAALASCPATGPTTAVDSAAVDSNSP